MKEINFEKWFFECYQDFEPLGDILKMIVSYMNKLPNFKNFIVWLLDHQTGFYHINFYNLDDKKENYHFDFINGITDKIKDYSDFEKVVIIKTLLTFLNNDLKIIKWYVEEVKEERETGFKRYSQEDYDRYIDEEYVFEYVILHFDLLLKKLNNNLPYLIEDKSKNLISLDGPYPKVGWTIEKNPNYKEITQTPPPDEVEPITLPENIDKIQINGNYQLLAFLFRELIEKGYINAPTHNGKPSHKRTAEMLLKHFEFTNKEEQPSVDNLTNYIKNNTYSMQKQSLFRIPSIKKAND